MLVFHGHKVSVLQGGKSSGVLLPNNVNILSSAELCN